jgi:NADPH:quinone reductase-like Zn-dependent oxidoreductase
MKAIAIDGYGEAGDLKLRDLPDPQLGGEEVLVRVRAAGVNTLDWKIRQGQLRLFVRLRFPYVPGSDIAGEVCRLASARISSRQASRSSRSAIQGAEAAMPNWPS